ncbi:MAG TPA: P-II family nitrogen regulator [Saprospiraceae bacterium]|nr:P-II family nitrogen regulator [Saprospiraceae bacterium]
MKKIEAIIRSSRFEEVKSALSEADINFFTFTEVKGFGKQKGDHVVYRGAIYDIGYIARLSLQIIISNDRLEEALNVIRNAAYTGEIGDGKIIVTHIDDVISIRTGKRNEEAL